MQLITKRQSFAKILIAIGTFLILIGAFWFIYFVTNYYEVMKFAKSAFHEIYGEQLFIEAQFGVIILSLGVIIISLSSLAIALSDVFNQYKSEEEPSKTIEHSLDNMTKECPMCMEKIKLKALKCRYCNHMFDPIEVEKDVNKQKEELKAEIRKEGNCPICGTQVVKAYIEDGSLGNWCPNCKASIKRLRGEL